MPTYQYQCNDCSVDRKIKKHELYDRDNDVDGFHNNGVYIFFKAYSIKDVEPNPKCPKCGGSNTLRSYHDMNLTCYIRGDGIVKDRAGARRDMNRHHLVNQDPYGHMRASGEVDHMLDKFRDAGRDMTSIKSKRAASSREAKRRADRMVDDVLTEEQEAVLLKINELENCEYSQLSEFGDINGILSVLIPDYVYKNDKDCFRLMAEGRSYVDKILDPE